MIRFFTAFVFTVLFLYNTYSQNFRWIDYYSYLKINQIISTSDDNLLAVSDNSFFTRDENKEINRFSSINGLTGDDISKLFYHNGLKKFFIIHTNGNIEIINRDKEVKLISDLYFNNSIPDEKKKCYSIKVKDNLLYMAMGYGISIFDLKKEEFKDTYYIGSNNSQLEVHDIEILGNNIFSATENGLRKADIHSILNDYNNWSKIAGGDWKKLDTFNQKLLAVKANNVYEWNGITLNNIFSVATMIHGISVYDSEFCVLENKKVTIYNSNYSVVHRFNSNNFENVKFLSANLTNKNLYIGTQEKGVLEIALDNSNNSDFITLNSPLYNDPFGLDVRDGNLWVVYGKHKITFNPYPLLKRGVSHYNGTIWKNIPYQKIKAKSLNYVQINPSDINEVYISSGHNGLIKINNDTQITTYNDTNSLLEAYVEGNYKTIRVFGIKFDQNNNLWVTQAMTPTTIKEIENNGNWKKIPTPGIFSGDNAKDAIRSIDFDKEGIVWFGTNNKGVLGIKPNGNYANLKDGLPDFSTSVKALAIDKNNVMWVGNSKGLRILSNPKRIFDNASSLSFAPIKIEFEGNVQLLLEGQEIISIKVDGSNNKWIGTTNGGAYYVSEDGKNTIFHFTKENSPLPSNEITDIAIDGKSGIVYFATAKGLIGFKGNSTEAAENLKDVYAFPNPVNMEKHNFVTIRGLIEGVSVKIIDVEGNLVYETKSKGGSVDWDLTAFGRYKVASGVYIVLISDDDGQKIQTTKIMVIK